MPEFVQKFCFLVKTIRNSPFNWLVSRGRIKLIKVEQFGCDQTHKKIWLGLNQATRAATDQNQNMEINICNQLMLMASKSEMNSPNNSSIL